MNPSELERIILLMEHNKFECFLMSRALAITVTKYTFFVIYSLDVYYNSYPMYIMISHEVDCWLFSRSAAGQVCT